MPELPEVETVKTGLRPYVLNQKILNVVIRNHNFRWPIADDFANNVKTCTIKSISRRSKYLLFGTDYGTIIIHLGMSGVLLLADQKQPVNKHDHVDFILSNNKIMRLNDPRRFGCVLWTKQHPLKHKLLQDLAPEPLSKDFNCEYLKQKICNRKTLIKSALMNSKLVVGVGNIYASETLFASKINPLRRAYQIKDYEIKLLVVAIKEVLSKAINAGGTTLKDFTNINGRPGYFKQELLVYGRKGEKCKVCQTIIKQTKITNRATYYCPICQPE